MCSGFTALFEFDLHLRDEVSSRIDRGNEMLFIAMIELPVKSCPEDHGLALSDYEPHSTDDFQVLAINCKRSRMQRSTVYETEPDGQTSRIRFASLIQRIPIAAANPVPLFGCPIALMATVWSQHDHFLGSCFYGRTEEDNDKENESNNYDDLLETWPHNY